MKFRCTRSSWTAGPGVPLPLRPFFVVVDHTLCSRQSRWTRFSLDLMPGGFELVGDEPIPELRIIRVDVDDRVHQLRVVPVPVRIRAGLATCRTPGARTRGPRRSPPPGSPRRQGHGPAASGHFGSVSVAKYAAARRRISFSISRRRFSRRSATTSSCSAVVSAVASRRRRCRPGPSTAARTRLRDVEIDATSARVRSPPGDRTTSRLNSGGNLLGIGTSFPPDHAGRKRCQPNLQQSR